MGIMKIVVVKFIGVKKYLMKDDATQEDIKKQFTKDIQSVPEAWRKNIEPVMYAEEEE